MVTTASDSEARWVTGSCGGCENQLVAQLPGRSRSDGALDRSAIAVECAERGYERHDDGPLQVVLTPSTSKGFSHR